MTQEERSASIQSLNEVFRFIEDLADAEGQRLKLYIQARGFVDEEEPIILKSEQKVQELRDKAEKIQRVTDLLLDEEWDDVER